MVTADFRPEAEFTLFLRMRTKHIPKSLGKYIPTEESFPSGNGRRWSEWQGQIFYRKLLNTFFCKCAVKICTKLAYIVVKSPQFYHLHKKSLSLNTMVTAVFRPEAELTIFLRMCTKEISKTW